MAFDVNKIFSSWEKDEPTYRLLGHDVASFIREHITDYDIFPEISHRTKDLLSIIKKIKKKSKEKPYTYNDLKDKLGIRIVCTYQEDLEKINLFLNENFNVLKSEFKKDFLDFDKLDYTSNHYDVCVKDGLAEFNAHPEYLDIVFEVQARTLNQHAWSNTAHSLAYKQEVEISGKVKRRIYRLLSLYEIADDEFSSVNVALGEGEDNFSYKLLRILEGKIYRYAKVDFDRASALRNIKVILAFLNEVQQNQLVEGIDKFILKNDEQLKQIFEENRIRYHEIDILTQPEIFIIWYCLDNFKFALTDNWHDEFDWTELEKAANLWGISVD
jgi:putative GTP pyrophosphokinase